MDVTRRTVLGAGLAAVAAGVAGCAASSGSGTVIHPEHPPTSPTPTGSTSAATTGAAPTTAGPSAARPLRLVQTPAQERATLASWRSTGDPVLHELRWSGAVAEVDAPAAASRASTRTPYGCTLFVAAGDPGRVMVGRNFDWDPNPAAVVRSRTDRGPRTIGMCDLSFVELPTAELPRIGEVAVRRRLLRAHGRVVDGMNQHGLFIGLAADLEARSVARPGTIVVGGVGIVRLVLDHAKDVRGALAMFERQSLEFAGGPGLHYLVADRSGASATIELVDGRLSVRERAAATPWQCLENFQLATTPPAARDEHPRYTRCREQLTASQGRIDADGALRLLDDVRQADTQWSAAYDLTAGTVVVRRLAGRQLHRYSV